MNYKTVLAVISYELLGYRLIGQYHELLNQSFALETLFYSNFFWKIIFVQLESDLVFVRNAEISEV